jgi:hypothetical protein
MSIKIPIISDFDGRGIKKAIAEFKALETSSQKAQFAIKKAAVPATAAMAGLTVVIGAATKAAMQDQAASAELARSLRATTRATDSVIASTEEWISTQSMLLGITDDELRPALGMLARVTRDVTSAQDLLKISMDAAQATGKPLAEVVASVSKAAGGNMRAFQQLFPEYRAMIRAGATFEEVMAEVAKTTGGAASDAADTAEGRMRRLNVATGEATEAIGSAFLPILETSLPVLIDVANWVEKNSKVVIAAGIAFGGLATAIATARAAMIVYKTIALVTTAVNGALAASGFAVQISTGVGIASAIAGMAILTGITLKLTGMFDKQEKATKGATKAAIENYEINQLIADDLPNFDIGGASAAAASAKVAQLNARLKELRNTIKGDFKTALDNAKGILKNAQDNFNNFAKSVSDSITGAFSFRDAKDAATETGQTFLQALTDQVTKTQDFAVKINRLLAAGLSEGALQQVLAAGQDAGGAIADELLAGGADAIGQANALTAKVQSLGASVGQNAATQFYQGGVDAGNALVAGISAVVAKYQLRLSSKGLTEKQLKRMQRNLGVDVDFVLSGGIPALADGGIVTGPTLALIGEAGPEAVVPLDRYNGGGGGNVTINVNGGDPQSVVNALRTYMRQNGSVPIRVSNIF